MPRVPRDRPRGRAAAGGGLKDARQFTDLDEAAIWAKNQNERYSLYYTLNPMVDIGSKLPQRRGSTEDVTGVFALAIDIDAERGKGSTTSATDDEKSRTIEIAFKVESFLRSLFPGSKAALVDSGNGTQMLLVLDALADKSICAKWNTFLEILAFKYNTEGVKIDTSVSDPPRVLALPGTMKRKGQATSERPHRPVRLMYWPEKDDRFRLEDVEKTLDRYVPLWHDRVKRRVVQAFRSVRPGEGRFYNTKLILAGVARKYAKYGERETLDLLDVFSLVQGAQDDEAWSDSEQRRENEHIVETTFEADVDALGIKEDGGNNWLTESETEFLRKNFGIAAIEEERMRDRLRQHGAQVPDTAEEAGTKSVTVGQVSLSGTTVTHGREAAPEITVVEGDEADGIRVVKEDDYSLLRLRSLTEFAAEDYAWGLRELKERFNLTDDGNAERIRARFGDLVRWVPESKCGWMIWNGQRWIDDLGDAAVTELATTAAKLIYRDEAPLWAGKELRRRVFRFALASESNSSLRAALELLKRKVTFSVTEFDRHPNLLNVRNGTIELLPTGESRFRAFDRRDLLTTLAGVGYDPGARCPNFLAFLEKNIPDAQVRAWLKRYAGYSLSGDTPEKKFAFAHGPTDTGKTTYTQALQHVLGDYAGTTDFSTLLESSGADRKRNELARLKGKRLIVAAESKSSMVLDDGLIKQLTGRDRITARVLFRAAFEYEPSYKLWIFGNEKPVIRSTDDSMWNRVRLVPWRVSIPKGEQDKALVEKLKAEGSGILNWMLEGYREWREFGLSEASAIDAATEEYRREMDSLQEFLDLECTVGEGRRVEFSSLRTSYALWCQRNGRYQLSDTKVGSRLAALTGVSRQKTSSAVVYVGIGLKQEPHGTSGQGAQLSHALQPSTVSAPLTILPHSEKTGSRVAGVEASSTTFPQVTLTHGEDAKAQSIPSTPGNIPAMDEDGLVKTAQSGATWQEHVDAALRGIPCPHCRHLHKTDSSAEDYRTSAWCDCVTVHQNECNHEFLNNVCVRCGVW